MRKPADLRALLTARIPALETDPGNLRMYVESGAVQMPCTPVKDFAYAYTLTVVIVDFTGEPSVPVLLINEWLRVNQPDLLQPGKDAYKFDAEIIDANTADLLFQIQLTEAVAVEAQAGGGFTLQHLAEPDPLFADDVPYGAPLTQVNAGGETVAGG